MARYSGPRSLAGALYRLALTSQWDPETAIPWNEPPTHPAESEIALVQVLTYLIENETAALLVRARAIAISDKAHRRLSGRDRRMTTRAREHNKVVVAIARELVGFLWAALTVEERVAQA